MVLKNHLYPKLKSKHVFRAAAVPPLAPKRFLRNPVAWALTGSLGLQLSHTSSYVGAKRQVSQSIDQSQFLQGRLSCLRSTWGVIRKLVARDERMHRESWNQSHSVFLAKLLNSNLVIRPSGKSDPKFPGLSFWGTAWTWLELVHALSSRLSSRKAISKTISHFSCHTNLQQSPWI